MAISHSPSQVLIAYDATKDHGEHELKLTLNSIRLRGAILSGGDRVLLLGILHKVPHPMGYQTKPCAESFAGTSTRAIEDEVSKKVDVYVNMLKKIPEISQEEMSIEVKVIAGFPIKQVILQEVKARQATWIVLDKHLGRELRLFLQQIPCNVALIQNGSSVVVLPHHTRIEADTVEHKWFFSLSKPVPLLSGQGSESIKQSDTSSKSYSFSFSSRDSSDTSKRNTMSSSAYTSQEGSSSLDFGSSYKEEEGHKGEMKVSTISGSFLKPVHNVTPQISSEAPILCAECGTRTELYIKDAMRFSFSEIELATDNFSKESLLGEGGYGHVYKGVLRNGQLIAAKVRKEASSQGFEEFHSEVYVLSFAQHKNIVMLLGFCCKENLNILVYEYICNKSLYWHLFDKEASVLEWHHRHAIAIGTAKGLRFLHEECRGGPIIHRDMRPSNILLTHDFVPMLGDFGLAKWKTSEDPVFTRVLGTMGYVAPEYAEYGIVSVRTDVYAFGIVLLQLISGRKVFDANREDEEQSLRQWADPLIERLALHEFIDPRVGDSYDTYELYVMAKAAYLCVQRRPEMRPSMGEVVRLLEGDNDHFLHLGEQFVPHYGKC